MSNMNSTTTTKKSRQVLWKD